MENIIQKIVFGFVCFFVVPFQIGCNDKLSGDAEKVVTDFTSRELSTEAKDESVDSGLCRSKREDMLQKSDFDIFEMAGDGGVGNCYYSSQSNACASYVKITTSTWANHGWALNPNSLDSTGCVSTNCYPGYTEAMCSTNLPLNAVEQIRDALRHPEDVCGLCDADREITVEMVLD